MNETKNMKNTDSRLAEAHVECAEVRKIKTRVV